MVFSPFPSSKMGPGEDETLETRRARYAAEAESVFHGRVFVPDDLEWIEL